MAKEKKDEPMTYQGSGVDYGSMDPFKRLCQQAGAATKVNLLKEGFAEEEWTRGESCYLIKMPSGGYLAHVEEGLGTKNLVADAMYDLVLEDKFKSDKDYSFYRFIAQCTVGMIVNDMITLGAQPLSVAMHLAVGEPDWFEYQMRVEELVAGWKHACDLAGCAWGGGETPTLRDIIVPGTSLLSGSAVGYIPNDGFLIKPRIKHNDAMVFFASSGIHANGLTLARDIAAKLPDGYLTLLPDGRTYGEALLAPTVIYVPIIQQCLASRVDIHYAVNVTGHGWRKLMRANEPFVYTIEVLPENPNPVFKFMMEQGPIDKQEAYGNLNMGVGFAIYVPLDDVDKVMEIAAKNGVEAWYAGKVTKEGNKKAVKILPKQIVFEGESLAVR